MTRSDAAFDKPPEPLDELRALSEAATPGPWHQYRITGEYVKAGNATVADLRYKSGVADAALIVAAVNYVRAVLEGRATDPTVCEVCGNLADGEPGRCHRHFRAAPATPEPARSGEEEPYRVEPGHNHTTAGLPTYPVFRAACPLGCDKPLPPTEQIEVTPGRFSPRPRMLVVDPIAEGEAGLALKRANERQRSKRRTRPWAREGRAALTPATEEPK